MELPKSNNRTGSGARIILPVVAVLLLSALPAAGLTRIRDITRLYGERSNKLVGHGLVVGLNGTGDGDSLVMTRPLAEMLGKLGNAVEVNEMSPKNVAYVLITADLGRNGVRDGDQIDVQVLSANSAKSLEGGTLISTFLRGPFFQDDRIYGIAQGPVRITDPANPASGVVKAGADIEENIFHIYVDYETYPGKAVFTLVLDDAHANFNTARMVAATINEEVSLTDLIAGSARGELSREPTAVVLGPKNIVVTIPAKQAGYPANFIARITDLPVDLPEPEARVVINETSLVISWTGNVEIAAPLGVTVAGIEIQIGLPPVNQGPAGGAPTAGAGFNQGAAKLEELMAAMSQLNVSAEDQIAVIYNINGLGVLRASVRTEK